MRSFACAESGANVPQGPQEGKLENKIRAFGYSTIGEGSRPLLAQVDRRLRDSLATASLTARIVPRDGSRPRHSAIIGE